MVMKMREIKYKAINTRTNEIEIVTDLYWFEENQVHDNGDNDWNLLEFTGLTDKNGVEICEGDIIRWSVNKHYWEAVISTLKNAKTNTLYAVETFNNVSIDNDNDLYTYGRNNSRKGARRELEFLDRSAEVIGNIHQNPELLK